MIPKNTQCKWLLLVFLVFASPLLAFGSDASRGMRFGLSAAKLIGNEIGPERGALTGAMFRYEFALNPRFSLGIHTSYRYSKDADTSFHQFVYGLVLQHYLGAKEAPLPIYVSYGLLLQVVMMSQVSGRGTAHDTRLAFGGDFDVMGYKNFSEVAYHYSRLHYFAKSANSLDHVELVYGVKI